MIPFDLSFGLAPVIFILLAIVVASLKILREYERGVVFSPGSLFQRQRPGLIIVIPGLQQMVRSTCGW